MKNKFYPLLPAFIIAGMVLCNTVKAQFVTLPDTNFVNWLKLEGLGPAINGDQLDTTSPIVLSTTYIYVGEESQDTVRNITGIQYFKSLDSLQIVTTGLSVVENLPSTLQYLDMEDNAYLDTIIFPPNLVNLVMYENPAISSVWALPASVRFMQVTYNFSLTSLGTLPASLVSLDCSYNVLDTIGPFPAGLTFIDCSYNNYIRNLPALPGGLTHLICAYNNLTQIPALPNTLVLLNCNRALNNELPNLSTSLDTLICSNCPAITQLPALPDGLQYLDCNTSGITTFPALPSSIIYMDCSYNPNVSLPALPASLQTLYCNGGSLATLPPLPDSLQYLEAGECALTSLPALPGSLWYLDCSYNNINTLPPLPSSLVQLYFVYTNVSSVPPLPVSLQTLNCFGDDSLTSLPPLPPVMQTLGINDCQNLYCLPMLTAIYQLVFTNDPISCLPNYGQVAISNPSLSTLPLCGPLNSSGCEPFWNVSGTVYEDANHNCIFDSSDAPQGLVKVQLFKHDTLLQQTFTLQNGGYSFSAPPGTYTIQVDTTTLPFKLSCPDSGYSTAVITRADSLSYNSFAFICRDSGFDLGVFSLNTAYVWPRPADTFELFSAAGDISQIYGARCAGGVPGKVQLIYNGAMHYAGLDSTALTPASISGDTVTWNIADFGAVNDWKAFNVLFAVDSNAVTGSLLCFTMNVTTTSPGDYNLGNNTLQYCIQVFNSLDPNEKEVYPTGLASGGEWLTYTIRFQNTGTAPAINIEVTDTLNPHLDPSTFQLLSYSAKNLTQISGNIADFYFPGINLPDSASNEPLSHGYVQYKIQVRSPLTPGTIITNKASVYFDLNPPVVTNTVQNCVPVYDSTSASIPCGDSLNFGGIFYHQPGSYNDTLTDVSGCDSIVTLQLSVTGGDTINQFGGICAGDSINFYGIWIYSPGMYQTTLPGTPCDTTAILSLVVMDPLPPTRVSDTICANDSLLFNGIYEHAAGTYTAHYSSANGCDSAVNLTLTVQPTSQTVTPASIACGDSIYFGGSYYHLSGTYGDTATNIDGCDSITTLQLTVTGGDTTYLNDTICSNDSLLFNGSYYNTGGTYTAQYNSVTNCDSTVILQLMVNQVYNTDTAVTISCGDSVIFAGIFYKQPGSYNDTLTALSGCDSVITLVLTVTGGDTIYQSGGICAGDSINFYGEWIYSPGQYDTLLPGSNTCDTLAILSLAIMDPLPPTHIYDTICGNDSLLFNGMYVDTAGTYNARYSSLTGCDSIVILQLSTWPAVTFSWDSLIAAGVVDSGNNFYSIFYCPPINLNMMVPLVGGYPPGGHYSGSGVSGDTLYPENFNYNEGMDTITYSFTDINLCTTSATATVSLYICEGIQTITPNNLFDLYPNPASDYTMIAIDPSAIGSTMKLLDITGKELLTMKLTATPQRIPVSTLAAGVYMVAVETKGGTGVKLLVKTE